MKKISRSVSTLLSLGATALLALMGHSCDITGPLEYGTPDTKYNVKVKVKNAAEQAIPGIEVRIEKNGKVAKGNTNEEGEVTVKLSTMSNPKAAELIARDVDGPANGEYQDATTSIPEESFNHNNFDATASVEITMKEKSN